MRVDEQLMDVTVLSEMELTHLWGMREYLVELRDNFLEMKKVAIYYQRLRKAVEAETKLHYVNENLMLVDSVINVKELDIFELTEYGEICLN